MNFPSPRIPELGQRDRFVKRTVKEGRVFTLADEQSACVSSQKNTGRTVQLFWSCPKEAKRWAKALAGEDGLQEISLLDFAGDILPGLKSGKGLAGTDWVTRYVCSPTTSPSDSLASALSVLALITMRCEIGNSIPCSDSPPKRWRARSVQTSQLRLHAGLR